MPGSDKQQQKGRNGKRKGFPVFGIVLIVCFVAIPAVFFYVAMQDAPGRAPAVQATVPPEEIADTPPPPIVFEPTDPPPPTLPPEVAVKGIYYHAEFATPTNLDRVLALIESTILNAVVIDVKSDFGTFAFETDNELFASAAAAFRNDTSTPLRMTAEIVQEFKSRGIYTIARVVCFKDDFAAGENPALAFQSTLGGPWRDEINKRWLDPYNRDSWEYIAEVCREAARLGFDEIQLDYVRFPVDREIRHIIYSPERDYYSKTQIINDFVAFIRDEMLKVGLRTSIDIFGITGISDQDADDIGQDVVMLLGSAHSLCPMIYPSHFANAAERGQFANGEGTRINGVLFEAPDTEPYEVIYHTLQHYRRRIERFIELNPGREPAIIRPYLQYFSLGSLPEGFGLEYGVDEVQAQIRAVHDAGFDEWLLWTTGNGFSIDIVP